VPHPYEDLVPLLESGDPAAMIHVDVSPDERSRHGSDSRRQAIARRLEADGGTPTDVAVLMRAFADRPSTDGPVGLLAIARSGRLVVDQLEPGRPPVADTAEVCTIPDVTVVVRAREADLPFDPVGTEAHASGGRSTTDAIGHCEPIATEQQVESRRRRALTVALSDDRVRGAAGLEAVVVALRAARVDQLLLRDGGESEVRELLALPAEPWLAMSETELLGVERPTRIPARAALVRAAVLTGASILFPPAEDLPYEVAATLRWTEASR